MSLGTKYVQLDAPPLNPTPQLFVGGARPSDPLQSCGYTVEHYRDSVNPLRIYERITSPDGSRVSWFELTTEVRS